MSTIMAGRPEKNIMPIDERKNRFKKLSRRRLVALAAFCVEHVIPIFDEMNNIRGQRQPHDAVALAWSVVDGEKVESQTVEALEASLGTLLRKLEESNLVMDAAKYVCKASILMLDTTIDRLPAKAVYHADAVLEFAHAAVEHFTDYNEPLCDGELRTQKAALRISESAAEPTRSAFAELLNSKPAWRFNPDS